MLTCAVSLKNMLTCVPDGGFSEPLAGLPLPENVEVAAGTELSEQARPLWGIEGSIESGQKGVVQHFKNFPFYPRPSFFITASKLLFVHHLSGEYGVV